MKNQLLKPKYTFKQILFTLMSLGVFVMLISCSNSTAEKVTEEAEAATEAITEAVTKTPIQEGEEWYLSYCTMCHGEDGKGGGALADSLRQPPLDLTTITLRRGEFSSDLMAKIIAGVETVPGHSTGDMPDWMETFKKSENITDEAVLNQKISHIVDYLESIQLSEWPEE